MGPLLPLPRDPPRTPGKGSPSWTTARWVRNRQVVLGSLLEIQGSRASRALRGLGMDTSRQGQSLWPDSTAGNPTPPGQGQQVCAKDPWAGSCRVELAGRLLGPRRHAPSPCPISLQQPLGDLPGLLLGSEFPGPWALRWSLSSFPLLGPAAQQPALVLVLGLLVHLAWRVPILTAWLPGCLLLCPAHEGQPWGSPAACQGALQARVLVSPKT